LKEKRKEVNNMEDKKLYTFICSGDDVETDIVIASSFEDACEIFKRNRQNDKVTQFIHGYGDFHYDEEETDLDEIKEHKEHYLALWDVSHYECTIFDEKDDIKYYEYEPDNRWDWFRLTIIEQPLKEYHMIVTCDEDNDPHDIYDVLQDMERYEAKIKTADIEKVVRSIEKGIRDNDEIVKILSNKDSGIIHPMNDFIDEFNRYMTLPVYEKLSLFNLLKGLRIKYPDIKFEAECGFTIHISFENEFEGYIRLYDKYIDFDSDFSHDIEIDITPDNDFNVILDSLIAEIDKSIQTYLSSMINSEEEEK
jgi:hypothetical protein